MTWRTGMSTMDLENYTVPSTGLAQYATAGLASTGLRPLREYVAQEERKTTPGLSLVRRIQKTRQLHIQVL